MANQAPQKTSGRRILVVEDDYPLALLLKHSLESAGYSVALAADGADAIGKLTREPPELIILDLMLPRVGGWEFLEGIRSSSDYNQIPVIILSARREARSLARGWLSDIDCYLTKPFSLSDLLSFVKRIFETIDYRKEIKAPDIGLGGRGGRES